MAMSFDTGGQIGSDGTGTISGTLAANAAADAIVAFVISNATNADQISGVTADGKAMQRMPVYAVDSATELGRVDGFWLADGQQSGGSQTIELTVSSSATKRLYAASLLAGTGNMITLYRDQADWKKSVTDPPSANVSASPYNEFYGAAYAQQNQSNPAATFTIPSHRTAIGLGALFTGNTAANTSVTSGSTQIAEANFSGNAQSGSFLRADAPVNNGNLTMGWTVATDDIAALWLAFEECQVVSGTYTNGGSPVANAYIDVVVQDSYGAKPWVHSTIQTDGSGNYSALIPIGMKWKLVPYRVDTGEVFLPKTHAGLV